MDDLKTWHDAKQHCNEMGARLMEIRTQEQLEKAQQFYQELRDQFWLGASDEQTEGIWVWDSNQEEVDLNEFWLDGRPMDGTVGNFLNCLIMNSQGMFDWYCSHEQLFVCEFN